MLLDFLGYGGNLGQAFLYNGGLETIQSYGMSVFSPPAEIASAMPKSHIEFFQKLESILVFDRFICVHAGLNPDILIEEQVDGDLFWIRDEFLNHAHGFRKTIVFGHTPHQEMFIHFPYKIGLDTGLVFGNKLSCLEMNSGRVIQVRRDAKSPTFAKLNMAALAGASGSYASMR
jgi:serine/threonine protein phosphatase 1